MVIEEAYKASTGTRLEKFAETSFVQRIAALEQHFFGQISRMVHIRGTVHMYE